MNRPVWLVLMAKEKWKRKSWLHMRKPWILVVNILLAKVAMWLSPELRDMLKFLTYNGSAEELNSSAVQWQPGHEPRPVDTKHVCLSGCIKEEVDSCNHKEFISFKIYIHCPSNTTLTLIAHFKKEKGTEILAFLKSPSFLIGFRPCPHIHLYLI